MDIATGAAEQHPNVLPLNPQPAPDPVTPRFPSGAEQGGVLTDISGVDFTAEAAAAMTSGMAADSGRRGRYAAGMAPLGGSTGDEMVIPDVPAAVVPPADSHGYPFSGMEPTPAAAGTDGIYPAA